MTKMSPPHDKNVTLIVHIVLKKKRLMILTRRAASRKIQDQGPVNTCSRKEKITIDESSIDKVAMTKSDYPTDVVKEAIARLRQQTNPIRDQVHIRGSNVRQLHQEQKTQGSCRQKRAKSESSGAGRRSPR